MALSREAKVAILLHRLTSAYPPKCRCGNHPAIAYCTECDKGSFFCRECWSGHQGFRLARNHFSVSLEDAKNKDDALLQNLLPNNAAYCQLHPDQKLELLCLTCGAPICVKCTLINKKGSAAGDGDRPVLQDKKEAVATALKEFPEARKKLQLILSEGEAMKKRVVQQREEVEVAVRTAFVTLQRLLNEREKVLLDHCTERATTKDAHLTLQMDGARQLLKALDDCQKLANIVRNPGEYDQMEFLSTLHVRISELLTQVSETSQELRENADIPVEVNTDHMSAEIASFGYVGRGECPYKVNVTLPARFAVGREVTVRVAAEEEEMGQGEEVVRGELTKKGNVKSQVIAATCNEEDRSYLLSFKPKEEGGHFLSITMNGQHIQNSPFLLPVNNCDYSTTFKDPVQTIDSSWPLYIAFSGNGDMFVTSSCTNSVHVYDKNGEKKTTIGKGGSGPLEFRSPYGIAIHGDVVFVADYSNHRIQKFTTSGRFLSMFGSQGTGDGQISGPTDICIGPKGMIYVSDKGNHRVVVFSDTGTFCRTISSSFKKPWGLAFAPDGNLHVTGSKSNNISVFTPEGNLIRSYTFSEPYGIAIDAAGYSLVITNDPYSFSIFSPNGQNVHTVKLSGPCFGVSIAPDGSVWVAGHGPNLLWKY